MATLQALIDTLAAASLREQARQLDAESKATPTGEPMPTLEPEVVGDRRTRARDAMAAAEGLAPDEDCSCR